MLGGVGYVESKPGQGTKVIARVPLGRSVEDLVKDAENEDDKSPDS